MSDAAFQRCIDPGCAATIDLDSTAFRCPRCGGLVDVDYDWERLTPPRSLRDIEARWARRLDPTDFSGVWRFRDLLPFARPEHIVTLGEGQTLCRPSPVVDEYIGLKSGRCRLQYEGLNPSGSFKDNGMAAAFTHARSVGATRAACASTGNTSASLAMYCAATGAMRAVVFIGSGKISYGKLAQALDHGALTVQIAGDFDDAIARVQQVAPRLGMYLVNSINPFRLEGQKTIVFRVLESLGWEVPDWIVVPGGNLGNVSAFGKAFAELKRLQLIDRLPRFAVINAAGANSLFEIWERRGIRWNGGRFPAETVAAYFTSAGRASTVASAIEINRPVNLPKALRALEQCSGVVREVADPEILDAKARIGAGGFGCEPASAASVAGARRLREEGVIGRDERVVCILTGHTLKDATTTIAYHTADRRQFEATLGKYGVHEAAFANRALAVENDVEAIVRAIRRAT